MNSPDKASPREPHAASEATQPEPEPAAATSPAAIEPSTRGDPDAVTERKPRDGSALWRSARKATTAVAVAQGFKTLRDQVGEGYLSREELQPVKFLGRGAFATVSLARLGPAGQLVAVKTLLPEALASEDDLAAFLHETRLLRKLMHGSIVQFVGCGGDLGHQGGSGDVFLVQEYCSGGSLQRLVFKQMTMPLKHLYSLADALSWSISIAKALAYLHSAKPQVIHRDLKLDNILLGGASGREIKLADFGLARLAASVSRQQSGNKLERVKTMIRADAASRNSSAGEAHDRRLDRIFTSSRSQLDPDGTPEDAAASLHDFTGMTGSFAYMSPEVLRGEAYGPSTDIFSFAMVMYNTFHRVIPSVQLAMHGGDASDVEMLAYRVASGYRPPLSDEVPAAVSAIIEKCWHGRPGVRPSARSLVKQLETVRDSGLCGISENDCHAHAGCSCVLS